MRASEVSGTGGVSTLHSTKPSDGGSSAGAAGGSGGSTRQTSGRSGRQTIDASSTPCRCARPRQARGSVATTEASAGSSAARRAARSAAPMPRSTTGHGSPTRTITALRPPCAKKLRTAAPSRLAARPLPPATTGRAAQS